MTSNDEKDGGKPMYTRGIETYRVHEQKKHPSTGQLKQTQEEVSSQTKFRRSDCSTLRGQGED